jgi:hypothetical protein
VKKKPEPKKPKPVYSNSTRRRVEIQQGKEKAETPEHGANCMCLYCRSQRTR